MVKKVTKQYSISLLKYYLPNIFLYVTETQFIEILHKAENYTKQNEFKEPDANFIIMLTKLLDEIQRNNDRTIRKEFHYFNNLLGDFQENRNNKNFKNFLKATLSNFKVNNFHHVLAEIAVCLQLSLSYRFLCYEANPTGKENSPTIDFKFQKPYGDLIYIEVLNIDYNHKKYEKHSFEYFINQRISSKFSEKCRAFEQNSKKYLFIQPIIHDLPLNIIKEQKYVLTNIKNSTEENQGYRAFNPKFFASIKNSGYGIFEAEEILNAAV